jgi:C4-dicarboxylate-specific signal transduction histidine kinase
MKRFLLFFAIALVVLLGFYALTRGGEPPVGTNDLAAAKQIALQLDLLLQTRMRATFALAAFPSMRAFAATPPEERAARGAVALNEAQALVAADERVRTVMIVDPSGSVILTTGPGWGASWGEREFVQNALKGQLDVSPPSRDGGAYVMYYAAPILDNAGEIAGALVLQVDANEMWTLLAAGKSAGSNLMLVDEEGVRIYDGGDATRLFTALARLDAGRVSALRASRKYGAEVSDIRAGNDDAVFRAVVQKTPPESLNVGAEQYAFARLATKPWTVVVVRSAVAQWPVTAILAALVIALAVAFLAARFRWGWR